MTPTLAAEVLDRLARLGADLIVDGGRVRLEEHGHPVPDEILAAFEANKPDVCTLAQARAEICRLVSVAMEAVDSQWGAAAWDRRAWLAFNEATAKTMAVGDVEAAQNACAAFVEACAAAADQLKDLGHPGESRDRT